jgi:hypothetical protein
VPRRYAVDTFQLGNYCCSAALEHTRISTRAPPRCIIGKLAPASPVGFPFQMFPVRNAFVYNNTVSSRWPCAFAARPSMCAEKYREVRFMLRFTVSANRISVGRFKMFENTTATVFISLRFIYFYGPVVLLKEKLMFIKNYNFYKFRVLIIVFDLKTRYCF